jgi:hypothetical protein
MFGAADVLNGGRELSHLADLLRPNQKMAVLIGFLSQAYLGVSFCPAPILTWDQSKPVQALRAILVPLLARRLSTAPR